jgi:hypothetical protein
MRKINFDSVMTEIVFPKQGLLVVFIKHFPVKMHIYYDTFFPNNKCATHIEILIPALT